MGSWSESSPSRVCFRTNDIKLYLRRLRITELLKIRVKYLMSNVQNFLLKSPVFHFQNFSVPHDDVIKWKHFPRNWPFVRGIHRSRWIPHTKASDAELWCFFFICVWINGWVNNREAGELRPDRGHYDVNVMCFTKKHEIHDIETRSHKSSTHFLLEPVGLAWFWGIICQNFFRNFQMISWEMSTLLTVSTLF